MSMSVKLNVPVESTVRVQFADTDCLNVVWHGNYLRFFERGRIDCLDKDGKLSAMLEKSDSLLAIKSIHVEYLWPAKLYDFLTIKTWVSAISRIKIDMFHEISNQKRLLSTANVEIICIGNDGHIKRIPEWMKAP